MFCNLEIMRRKLFDTTKSLVHSIKSKVDGSGWKQLEMKMIKLFYHIFFFHFFFFNLTNKDSLVYIIFDVEFDFFIGFKLSLIIFEILSIDSKLTMS